MYLGLLAVIDQEVLTNETILRYLTGHPVSKITVAMFFIGTASLLMIGHNVFEQFGALKRIRIDALTDADSLVTTGEDPDAVLGTEAVEKTDAGEGTGDPVIGKSIRIANAMLGLPHWIHDHYLWQRIVNALHSIYRNGSAANVESELKYFAEMDFDRQQQRYSLVRILIWATPMLGFLGTVLGISQALGGISIGPENDFQGMMNGLRGSLYVAFDTTALALTLSMVLMFGQFLIDRFESQLLEVVDNQACGEIARHFDLKKQEPLSTGDQINKEVFAAMNLAVESQTELWRKTMKAAEQAWISSLGDVSDQVREQLSFALEESVGELAQCLGQAIHRADDSMSQRWEQWQVTLSENARQLVGNQNLLADHTEIIKQVLERHPALLHAKATADLTELSQPPATATSSEILQSDDLNPEQDSEPDQTAERLAATMDATDELASPAVPETASADPSVARHSNLEPIIIPFSSFDDPTPVPSSEPARDPTSELPLVIFPISSKETSEEVDLESSNTMPSLHFPVRDQAA